MQDIALDMVEYLAILISPSPKDTMKAIEKRRKIDALDKKRRGIKTEEEFKLFKQDHRNTTFYDEIAKVGGEETVAGLMEFFGETEKDSTVEDYELDMEDLEFIEKANKLAMEQSMKKEFEGKLDTIEF